jgi:hypothetical protein
MKTTILIISALIFSSCNDIFNSDENVKSKKEVKYVSFGVEYCGNTEFKYTQEDFIVISSNEEMANFIEMVEPLSYDSLGNVIPFSLATSHTDFSKTTLVAITLGERPSTGYTVNIQSVYEEEEKVIISAVETIPYQGDDAISYPMKIIRINRGNLNIEFLPLLKNHLTQEQDFIINNEWKFVGFGNSLLQYSDFELDNFWIEFTTDCNKGNGMSGCNSFSFSYGISGDKLSILRGGTTKVYCPLSEEFQIALGNAVSYRLKNKEFIIETDDKLFGRMHFILKE